MELSLPELPPRATASHKGDYGRVLLVAGSRAYPGAAILAALGAGRAGAGLVELAVPEPAAPLVLPAVPFAILASSAADADGGFAASAADALLARAAAADALLVGPGLGRGAGAWQLVRRLVAEAPVPLVIDADGLNAVAAGFVVDDAPGRAAGEHAARAAGERSRPDAPPAEDGAEVGRAALRARTAPTVLTPHPEEFRRLAGGARPTADERVARAAALARATGAVVVLKGAGSVVTDGERTRVETAGNPGLATGGTGDVLAGAITALLARLDDPAGAAALAVHLHAVAGDLAAADLGQEAVLPGDVADRLGRAARG